MVRILPQTFYESLEFKKLLVDGLSCAIHKKLDAKVLGKEGFISTHAITMVMKGLLRVENSDGLFVEVPAGKMVFLPKGLYTVSDILPKQGSFEAMMFFFERDAVIEGNEQTRYFAESLLRLYGDSQRPNRQLTKMKLFELLHLIHNSYEDKTCFAMALSTLNNKERKSLREFMQANYSKPLNIEDYAYLTGRSLSTFRRDFKAQFGISPKQWLIDRRLEKAHELLSKNQTTVTNVVMEIGYENIPHFIKTFKDRYGLPPKQFLIQQRKAVLV
jgi:AraC family transcriptional regulator, exoenzyme S synthesis regulatory protein ExsA